MNTNTDGVSAMSAELSRAPAMMVSALKGHGRELRMFWPEDISTREVDYVLELVALQMRTCRRIAELREAGIKGRGDLEWNSWFADGHPARVNLPNKSMGLAA
jgi:hypothetical protein